MPAEDEAQKARTSFHYQQRNMYFKVQKALRHKLLGSGGSQEYHEKDNSYRVLSLHCRKLWGGAPLGTGASLSKRWVSPRIQALQPLIWDGLYLDTSRAKH